MNEFLISRKIRTCTRMLLRPMNSSVKNIITWWVELPYWHVNDKCYRINANEQMGGIKAKSTGSFAFFSPRPHSVHFPRRYSFSPRSTWEPVCRLGERGHKPLCVKKNVNICRMSDWGMRFRFWPSESRASGGLAWSSTLCMGLWRIEVFCWSERNVFPNFDFQSNIFPLPCR